MRKLGNKVWVSVQRWFKGSPCWRWRNTTPALLRLEGPLFIYFYNKLTGTETLIIYNFVSLLCFFFLLLECLTSITWSGAVQNPVLPPEFPVISINHQSTVTSRQSWYRCVTKATRVTTIIVSLLIFEHWRRSACFVYETPSDLSDICT